MIMETWLWERFMQQSLTVRSTLFGIFLILPHFTLLKINSNFTLRNFSLQFTEIIYLDVMLRMEKILIASIKWKYGQNGNWITTQWKYHFIYFLMNTCEVQYKYRWDENCIWEKWTLTALLNSSKFFGRIDCSKCMQTAKYIQKRINKVYFSVSHWSFCSRSSPD